MPTVNVLNRYSERVEIQFDAAFNSESPYVWQPGEVKSLPQDVALFVRRKSILKEDPITGKQVRALLVQGVDREYDEHAGKGAELLPYRGIELLDRTNMDEKAKAVVPMTIANPVARVTDREAVTPGTHARRVP